jgi:hypothetical protein
MIRSILAAQQRVGSKRRPSQLNSINKSSPGGMRREVQTRVENEGADVSSQTIHHKISYVLIFILYFEKIMMISSGAAFRNRNSSSLELSQRTGCVS